MKVSNEYPRVRPFIESGRALYRMGMTTFNQISLHVAVGFDLSLEHSRACCLTLSQSCLGSKIMLWTILFHATLSSSSVSLLPRRTTVEWQRLILIDPKRRSAPATSLHQRLIDTVELPFELCTELRDILSKKESYRLPMLASGHGFRSLVDSSWCSIHGVLLWRTCSCCANQSLSRRILVLPTGYTYDRCLIDIRDEGSSYRSFA